MKTLQIITVLILMSAIGWALINLAEKRDAYYQTCSVNHQLELMYDCNEKDTN